MYYFFNFQFQWRNRSNNYKRLVPLQPTDSGLWTFWAFKGKIPKLKAKHCRIWKILYLKADEDEFGDHEGEGEEENLDLDSASISAFQMEPHVKEVLRYGRPDLWNWGPSGLNRTINIIRTGPGFLTNQDQTFQEKRWEGAEQKDFNFHN